MEQKIHITLRFNLAIGKIGLNEIVYKLKEVRDSLMLKILQQVLTSYDDLISERLSRTDIYPSKDRKKAWGGMSGKVILKADFVEAVRY